MQTESDRMKQRFVESFIAEQARIDAEKSSKNDAIKTLPIQPKTKTITAKTLFAGTKQIKSKQDIDVLLDELRVKLEAQLDGETMIQIIQ